MHPLTLTWTCHVCKQERPDALIAALKASRLIDGMVVVRNVRYCLDQPACYDGSVELARSFLDRLEGAAHDR